MISNDDINAYINFALYAVFGKLAEADALMCMHGDSVRRVADVLAKEFPIESKPIYRGVLVDPAEGYSPSPNFRFVSWSEDVDVARWFGSRDSYISEPMVAVHPEAQGFVLTLAAPTNRVLFHHTWSRAFGPSLERLALSHPLVGPDGARQVQWSLRTQQEVITEPLTVVPELQPIDSVAGADMASLNARLTPSWVGKDDDGGFFIMFTEG